MSAEILDDSAYLRNVRSLYLITKIYYPGCGNDNTLTAAFDPSEIYGVDVNSNHEFCGNFMRANYSKFPFRTGTFDAVFIQDNHAESTHIAEIVRTLKVGGIIIYSIYDDCGLGTFSREELRKIGKAKKVQTPFSSNGFTLYQKTIR